MCFTKVTHQSIEIIKFCTKNILKNPGLRNKLYQLILPTQKPSWACTQPFFKIALQSDEQFRKKLEAYINKH